MILFPLLAYADDMIVVGNSYRDVSLVKEALSKKFEMKDLGPLQYFLGLEIAHFVAGISMCPSMLWKT